MPEADIESIAEDLAGVEVALDRLEAGTYWTDEVTEAELPDELLAADPVARRVPPPPEVPEPPELPRPR